MTHISQWTCAGGALPAPAPQGLLDRTVDTYLRLTAPVLRSCWAIPIALAVFLVSRAMGVPGLYLVGLFLGAYSAYCLANFARCREAHCIVTGVGWGILTFVALVAAATQHDWLGPIWNAFLIILVVGYGFEWIWVAARHTRALRV